MPKIIQQTAKPTKVAAPSPSANGDFDPWASPSIRLLLYGESATGKTSFWSTFPGPILALICSGGRKPGELISVEPENRKKIKPVIITSTEALKEQLEVEGKRYATVVLDHISGIQDLDLKEVLGIEEIPAVKTWGMAVQEQYGACVRHCTEYCRAALNLPGNVVIVGQERVFDAKTDTGSELMRPKASASVMPSFRTWLEPACDYILQTFIRPRMQTITVAGGEPQTVRGKGVEYCLRTEEHDFYKTKIRRSGRKPLPECIVDPTYDKLIKIIGG